MLVRGGNAAGQFLFMEEPDKRRSLQGFLLVGIVTLGAIGLKYIAPAKLFRIERPRWSASFRRTARKDERKNDQQRAKEE